jgi:LmbE family N-acetylglucosaminyl deacetylase
MKTVIIFAPHMDDEVIGCAGIILRETREHNRVVIVYMTKDDTRKQEAMSIMKKYGLAKNLVFLNYQKMDRETVKDAISRTKKIIEKENPQEVYVTAYEGGHIVHDITNFIVNRAVKENGRTIKVYEYPTYNNYPAYIPIKIVRRYTSKYLPVRTGIFPPMFIPAKTKEMILKMQEWEIETKKAMIRGYESQNKNDYLVKNFLYNDRFRLCPNHNYRKRPHGTLPLNYTLARRQRFKDFREAINI